MLDWVQKKKNPLESIISCEPHLMLIASPHHFHYIKMQLIALWFAQTKGGFLKYIPLLMIQ